MNHLMIGQEQNSRLQRLGRHTGGGLHSARIQSLIDQLRSSAPQWAELLLNASTEHEFTSVLCKLFNLSSLDHFSTGQPIPRNDLKTQFSEFVSANLSNGPTLKLLAQQLGYSDKYCSELFRSVMGEPFSRYVAHQRIKRAILLLTTTKQSITTIADMLGFSDQFSFSHFFKREAGQSPREFRANRAQRRPYRISDRSSRRTR